MGIFSSFLGGASLLSGIKDIVGIGGDIKDVFASPAEQQFKTRPPFRGTIVTPAFTFGGGVLSRTGTDVFSSQDFATRLGTVRTGLTGLGTDLAGIRPRIGEGLSRVSSLFGESGLLRGRIGKLDKTLAGLLAEVRPGFGRLSASAERTIRNREAATAGNLRASLNQRGILGASFANAQIASISKDFAELEEQAKAQAIVQEIEQSRLITKDRAGLVELSGRLIELDQRSLVEQARLIGLDLQLNEQQANLFAQQVSTIQTEMQVLRDQVSRELLELNISTSFLAIVDQLIGGSASAQVQQLASSVSSGTRDGSGDEQRERTEQLTRDRISRDIGRDVGAGIDQSERERSGFGDGAFGGPGGRTGV